MKRYISEDINSIDFRHGQFNLIVSGTGTGKTEFIRRGLLKRFPDVAPSEVLYVTSRSMIRDQQSTMEGIDRFDNENAESVVRYWNAESDRENGTGVWIMNYSQLIRIMDIMNPDHGRLFKNIKIAVFDECHTIYSDHFIEGMLAVRMWIRERVVHEDVLCIGLTATPDIMFYYSKRAGIKTKMVNKEKIINYKAKHLICTKFDCLPELLEKGTLSGVTMIMCVSVGDCNWLHERVPNSVMICSASNAKHNDEMAAVRQYIVENGRLPPYINADKEPLNVLITTSTMREGVNLLPESEIKNVVCCLTDELHVKQFVGRCRFDVENLVVAQRKCRIDNYDTKSYLAQSRRDFETFLRDRSYATWFYSISDILDVDIDDVELISVGGNEYDFRDMIDEVWACPDGIDKDKQSVYWIYKEEDKQSIVDYAYRCGLLGKYRSQYSFVGVLKYMEERFGYSIDTNRARVDGKQITYKLIHEREYEDYDE